MGENWGRVSAWLMRARWRGRRPRRGGHARARAQCTSTVAATPPKDSTPHSPKALSSSSSSLSSSSSGSSSTSAGRPRLAPVAFALDALAAATGLALPLAALEGAPFLPVLPAAASAASGTSSSSEISMAHNTAVRPLITLCHSVRSSARGSASVRARSGMSRRRCTPACGPVVTGLARWRCSGKNAWCSLHMRLGVAAARTENEAHSPCRTVHSCCMSGPWCAAVAGVKRCAL
jgi:hypothetical protein